MTCLSLSVIMPSRGEDRMRAFSFCTPTVLLNFTFFWSRWLGDFCTRKKCIPSSCTCGTSVHESDFFYFLIPPPLPKSSPFSLMWSRGIECRLLELRLPGWVRIQPWIWACGLAELGVTLGSACAGVSRAVLPFHPTPAVTGLSHTSKLPGGEIAAPITHCSGWFKSSGEPSFYFFVCLQFWKIQSSWIPAGGLIQEKCQEIKLSATCKRVKILENAPKHNPGS